ncbi:GTPase domain-containing protein [Lujinxingia vulgaris]|uniref:GTPase domain-containing protein n=1 Tax=Lujinxingia vulgaris TaxID=2600176 RepID=A0A5C6X3X6_9DELT|nr:GTPase domain-containing protein [Lujinxingia vulgaris]TXD33788.1 GTPase domain-containing protein [Lujinxingia vulgaris]
MPFPLVPVIIAGVVGFFAGAVAVNLYDESQRKVVGKKFGLLGERATGKTTLIYFLQTGRINKNVKPTQAPDNFPVSERSFTASGNHGTTRTFPIKMKEGVDVGGGASNYETWQKIVKDTDILLYLFRADKALENDTHHCKRIKKDISQIYKWLDERKTATETKPKFFAIGTHCDLSDEFNFQTIDERVEYIKDEFSDLPLIREIYAATGTPIILGSLDDEQKARGIVVQLFKHINT